MPLVTYEDAGGVPIRFMEVDGIRYPYVPGADQDHSIPAVKQLKGRDDDVILVSHVKSGTHWMWEVLSMLHQGKAETIPYIKQFNMLEALKPENVDSISSPRILNSHLRFDQLPVDMIRRKAKIVLIHRNPKDVAVSLYHHSRDLLMCYDYHGDWKNWFPLFLAGTVDYNSWFDYVKYWERVMDDNPDYPIHLMYYEDMKEDSTREVEALAKFFGLPVTDELCKAIGEKCSFERMKEDKAGLEPEVWVTAWRDNKPGFYRKGAVGDWKNWFTVAQNEAFDQLYKAEMKDSKLKIRFEI